MRRTTKKPFIKTLSISLCLATIIICATSSCGGSPSLSPRCREALDSLNRLLPQREAIMSRHKAAIDSTAKAIASDKTMASSERFYAYKRLFFSSHLFTSNYSILFSRCMANVADSMGDPVRHAEAMTYYGYSLARCGLFKEGIDTLESIHISDNMPDSVLYVYYAYTGRAYHDLAAYGSNTSTGSIFSKEPPNAEIKRLHTTRGNAMFAKALKHAHNDVERLYVRGKMLNFGDHPHEALPVYTKAASLCKPDDVEWQSVLLSTIGIIYNRLDNREAATYYDMLSMINDIRHAIVESNAPGNVAGDLFYGYGETEKSFACLNVAMDDASYYGSRYRINMMGGFLPMIMQQRQTEQENRHTLMAWAIFALMVFAALLVFLLRKNTRTSRLLQARNGQLTEAYRQLSVANSRLDSTNRRLSEATRLKNQYLGHYMDKEQETINQINDFTLMVSQKLALGQTQPLQRLLKEFRKAHDQKAERNDFDRTFTAAFPTFVDEFNALMTPDARQTPDTPNKLTPVLRIYALVRLGITDTKRIARALDYTVNTVYNYRVRTRNKALSPHTFEEDVTQIGL